MRYHTVQVFGAELAGKADKRLEVCGGLWFEAWGAVSSGKV